MKRRCFVVGLVRAGAGVLLTGGMARRFTRPPQLPPGVAPLAELADALHLETWGDVVEFIASCFPEASRRFPPAGIRANVAARIRAHGFRLQDRTPAQLPLAARRIAGGRQA